MRASQWMLHERASGPSLEGLVRRIGPSCSPLLATGAIRSVIFPGEDASTKAAGNAGARALGREHKKKPRSEGLYAQPVRGLVAERAIARGETIMSIPLRGAPAALTAGSAAAVLCDVFSHHGGTQLCRSVANIGTSSCLPEPQGPQAGLHTACTTRDPLLITAAVAVIRAMDVAHPTMERLKHDPRAVSPATAFFQEYVSLLPKRVPVLGALAWSSGAGSDATHRPLERRLRAGEVSVPLLGAEPTDADTRALILSQVRQGNAVDAIARGGLTGAAVEVVPTTHIMTSFYGGQLVRGSGQQRVHGSVEAPAFLKHLGELQAALDDRVLRPMAVLLARCASPSTPASPHRQHAPIECIDDDDEAAVIDLPCAPSIDAPESAAPGAVSHWLDILRWSHFMVRSRSVWVDLGDHPAAKQTTCALVPLADMINHDGVCPNVRFTEGHLHKASRGDHKARANAANTAGPLVLHVVATRAIDIGEEITCDYNDAARRNGVVLPDDTSVAKRDAAAEATLRRIEQEQRYEVVSAEHLKPRSKALQRPSPKARTSVTADIQATASSVGTRTFGSPEEKRRMLDRRYEHSRKDAALVDAEWAFQYGFVKSSAEKEAEASCLWDDSLMHRVAHLTDVRRKGRPGEFVIGVPEGLRHLYTERERLQRERYGGQRVFPPQRV